MPNIEKFSWEPCKILTLSGRDIKITSGTFKIPKTCTENIFNINFLILRKIFVSARILAKIAGQLISTMYVKGQLKTIQFKARFFYKSIEQSSSWDKTFNIASYNDTVDEIESSTGSW